MAHLDLRCYWRLSRCTDRWLSTASAQTNGRRRPPFCRRRFGARSSIGERRHAARDKGCRRPRLPLRSRCGTALITQQHQIISRQGMALWATFHADRPHGDHAGRASAEPPNLAGFWLLNAATLVGFALLSGGACACRTPILDHTNIRQDIGEALVSKGLGYWEGCLRRSSRLLRRIRFCRRSFLSASGSATRRRACSARWQ